MKDADGFELLKCANCKEVKLAGLFPPSRVLANAPWCIKCCAVNSSKQIRRSCNAPPSKESWSSHPTISKHGKVLPLFGGK